QIRAAEPIKGFLVAPRERVASFPEPLEPGSAKVRTLLFGVKGCDLGGLAVHERMFLFGEFRDPFYAERLNSTILVAADCPKPEKSCFCNLLGRRPYESDGADLSLTVLDEGWLVEVVSERGRELIEKERDGFEKAEESQLAKRDEQRQKAIQILKQHNPREWSPNLAQAIAEKTNDTGFWTEAAAGCVECFGCLLTCPTCFCFLLYDGGNAERFERTKVWDFCYIPMYARVGGGANPRARFIQRFINRFHCKFMHSKNQNGFYACSGCGRCFTTCMGKIDIRNILGQL
ncbi:MAG: 4Fe-4S dicluster domain-containing protein, partial [bacterium]